MQFKGAMLRVSISIIEALISNGAAQRWIVAVPSSIIEAQRRNVAVPNSIIEVQRRKFKPCDRILRLLLSPIFD